MEQDAKEDEAYSPCKPKEKYDRTRDLPRLIGLWPNEIEDRSAGGSRKIISKLRQALRAKRIRGLSGHWSYDLGRHLDLVNACKNEIAALEAKSDPGQSNENG